MIMMVEITVIMMMVVVVTVVAGMNSQHIYFKQPEVGTDFIILRIRIRLIPSEGLF